MLFVILLLVAIGYVIAISMSIDANATIGADGNKSKIHGVDYVKLLSDRVVSDVKRVKNVDHDALMSAIVDKFRSLNATFDDGAKKGQMLVKSLRQNWSQIGGGGGGDSNGSVADETVGKILDKQENLIRIVYPKLK